MTVLNQAVKPSVAGGSLVNKKFSDCPVRQKSIKNRFFFLRTKLIKNRFGLYEKNDLIKKNRF